MKVGFIAPMSIAAVNGGLRTQALQTIKYLKNLGVEAIEISPWTDIQNLNCTLFHVFGATIENAGIVKALSASETPMVLSPVFYSNRSAFTIKHSISFEKLLGSFGRGIRSEFSIKKELCEAADLVFPNTSEEANLIKKGFSLPSKRIRVIPNAVEESFVNSSADLFRETYSLNDFILFVGQAGAKRKNVKTLLRTAHHFDNEIVIIGSFDNSEYSQDCKRLIEKASNVTYIGPLSHNSPLLASAYAASKVFVLPSQFETPGIAAMEAALAGSSIVITKKGGTKDYFKDLAEYIDPGSEDSLIKGIKNALQTERSDQLKNHILNNFTWKKVAEETLKYYKELAT